MVLWPTVPPTYWPCTDFRRDLEARVAGYFDAVRRSRHGSWRLYLKTAILMTWLAGSYVALVWLATSWWQAVPLADLAGAGDGRRRVQHPARRQPRCLLEPRRRQPGGGALAEPAGRRRLLLALQAQHRPPQLSERHGLRRRHPSRPAGRACRRTNRATGSTGFSTSMSGGSTRCWRSTGSSPATFVP